MDFYQLKEAIILVVSGKDSKRYLNNRLTNDIKSLKPGSGCLAAALSAQGRCEGFFTILCINESEFMLCCDGGERERVIAALKRFIVADRVEVNDLSDAMELFVEFYSAAQESPPHADLTMLYQHKDLAGGRAALTKRWQFKSVDLIAEKDSRARDSFLARGYREISEQELRLRAVKACIPSYPHEINESALFAAANVPSAVSFKKGCYVGQEVIEKIDAIGKAPRLLKALTADGKVLQAERVDAEVNGQPAAAGKIMTACYDSEEDRTYFFVEIKNNDSILGAKLLIDGREARILC